MTPYITLTDLTGKIPGPFLIEALDDNGDGAADPDVVSAVIADACNQVDAILGGSFSNPLPAKVTAAAAFFAIEILYKRRGKAEGNPYAKDADNARAQLDKVAKGEELLVPKISVRGGATAITEPAATKPSGRMNS